MRLVVVDDQGKVLDVPPERFILIVAGDTPEGRQCILEVMNARQAEVAAFRKFLKLTEAKALKASAAASTNNT